MDTVVRRFVGGATGGAGAPRLGARGWPSIAFLLATGIDSCAFTFGGGGGGGFFLGGGGGGAFLLDGWGRPLGGGAPPGGPGRPGGGRTIVDALAMVF